MNLFLLVIGQGLSKLEKRVRIWDYLVLQALSEQMSMFKFGKLKAQPREPIRREMYCDDR